MPKIYFRNILLGWCKGVVNVTMPKKIVCRKITWSDWLIFFSLPKKLKLSPFILIFLWIKKDSQHCSKLMPLNERNFECVGINMIPPCPEHATKTNQWSHYFFAWTNLNDQTSVACILTLTHRCCTATFKESTMARYSKQKSYIKKLEECVATLKKSHIASLSE